ncbi:MAG: hypothetical protein WC558_16760 [Patulibacter sp.]
MSNATHIIALVAAAVVITTILTLGTLAAADLLPARSRRKPATRTQDRQPGASSSLRSHGAQDADVDPVDATRPT